MSRFEGRCSAWWALRFCIVHMLIAVGQSSQATAAMFPSSRQHVACRRGENINAGGQEPTCGTDPFPPAQGFTATEPIFDSQQVWSFVSEPDLHPMRVAVNHSKPGADDGYVFTAPFAPSAEPMYGQTGALIMDKTGDPVWFRPLNSTLLMNCDLRRQYLDKQPVLTFWQGTVATPPAYINVPQGSGEPGACFYIMDSSYRVIRTVSPRKGYVADQHEFRLTPGGTALFFGTKVTPMDLTPYGGPKNGSFMDYAIQEVDLKTNKLVFFWSARDHIPFNDSYMPASTANESSNVWDVFHFNSIGLAVDDISDIIVSSRNMWAVYKINRPTSKIVWQLGGKRSDFTIKKGAEFSWQHDARELPGNVITMFDDNCCEGNDVPAGTPPSRGLALKLDMKSMTASADAAYYHDPNINVPTMGNVQTLSNGNQFVGWGQLPYISEYTEAGNTLSDPTKNLIYNATMPGDNLSYRSYLYTWVGTPHYPPSVSARQEPAEGNTANVRVFASWNGSTETRRWVVLGGRTKKQMAVVARADKAGFETAIDVDSSHGPYFMVQALDAANEVIGQSEVVKVDG